LVPYSGLMQGVPAYVLLLSPPSVFLSTYPGSILGLSWVPPGFILGLLWVQSFYFTHGLVFVIYLYFCPIYLFVSFSLKIFTQVWLYSAVSVTSVLSLSCHFKAEYIIIFTLSSNGFI
jgi:hypothetical protein